MTVTYTEDLKPYPKTKLADAPFTPSYARKPGSKKAVKTWMILVPIGVLALAAGGATLLMSPAAETAPLAEPAPSLSIPAPSVTPAAPVETAPLVIENGVIEPAPAPAREVRQAPAARRAAPAPTTEPRVETPPQPAGPQPYTGSLNTATPAPAPTTTPVPVTSAPTAPPPVVVIEPEG